jgi:hypothetical protein
MNYFKYTLTFFASYLILAIPAAMADDDSEAEDQRLSQVFDKMKKNSANLAINLDSSFGGGRCNCVCKDNK